MSRTEANRFGRLTDRYKEIRELSRQDQGNDAYLSEMDTLGHFFEAGGVEHYSQIASFCKERNIKRVVDIGCAYGHQSEIFMHEDIDYLGIERGDDDFWNSDKFTYVTGMYPCEIPVNQGDLAVSVLCLGWNCYLHENEVTLRKQCEALRNDFEHCLLYLPKDKVEAFSKHFKRTEFVDSVASSSRLVYFSNRD